MDVIERWTIWKAVGREDDAIHGPDCHGVDVAPVDELMVVRRQLAEAVEENERLRVRLALLEHRSHPMDFDSPAYD